MKSAGFPPRGLLEFKNWFCLHFLPVLTAIHMASNGPSKRGIYTVAKLSSIGCKQISAMARDETKRFSSARPGTAPWTMIAKSYLRLRNWRPPFAVHRNLRLNHHSKRLPALRRYAKYGPIAF